MKQPKVVARGSKSKMKNLSSKDKPKSKPVKSTPKKEKKDKKKKKEKELPPIQVNVQPPALQAPSTPSEKKGPVRLIDTKHQRIPEIQDKYGLEKTTMSSPYVLTPEFQPKEPVSEVPFVVNPYSGQPSEIGVQHDYSQTLHQHHGEVGLPHAVVQYHHHSPRNQLKAGVLQELWENPVQRNINIKPTQGPKILDTVSPVPIHTGMPKPPEGYDPLKGVEIGFMPTQSKSKSSGISMLPRIGQIPFLG